MNEQDASQRDQANYLPLSWENIQSPLGRFIPLVEYRKANKLLARRDPAQVERSWYGRQPSGEGIELVFSVSRIIAMNCRWVNAYFIPKDECSVLFWARGWELDDVSAVQAIQECFEVGDDLMRDIENITYGDFIERIRHSSPVTVRRDSC